jgi:hypothetical protein
MAIHLESPSLLLNSYDFTDAFGGFGMLMDRTWNCPKYTTVKHIANWIGIAAKEAGGRLANVVLNFHGEPGRVLVGEATPGKMMHTGTYIKETFHVIDNDNAGVLFPLRQFKIGTLWFHSCDLAGGTIGKTFCRQVAMMAAATSSRLRRSRRNGGTSSTRFSCPRAQSMTMRDRSSSGISTAISSLSIRTGARGSRNLG